MTSIDEFGELTDGFNDFMDKLESYNQSLQREMEQREQAEKRRHLANERYQAVLKAATTYLIVATDPSGIIKVFNEGAQRMLGYRADELVDKMTPEIFYDRAELNARMAKLGVRSGFEALVVKARKGEEEQGECAFIHKNGKMIPVEVSITAEYDEKGHIVGFLGIATNISERKRAEEQLRATMVSRDALMKEIEERKQAQKELESAQSQLVQSEKMASIGQLAAGVAHEINNPVGFISNNMELLEQYVSDYTKILRMVENLKISIEVGNIEKAKSIIKEMSQFEKEIQLDYIMNDTDNLIKHNLRGIERIKKIVMDLRTFAREGNDEMELVKVEEIIDSILTIVQNELKYKADVKKDYGDTPLIKGNAQRLGQVFINLFVNAVQAISDKGIIEVKTYVEGKYLCIVVSDTGEGIPPENINRVFDAFFTTKPIGQGTGLGLSVSYEFIKKHGGDMKVR